MYTSLTLDGYFPLFLQNSSAEIQGRSLLEHEALMDLWSHSKALENINHILCCIYSQHNLLPLLTPITWNAKPQNEQIRLELDPPKTTALSAHYSTSGCSGKLQSLVNVLFFRK